MDDAMKLSLKMKVYSDLCMSNIEFSTPTEFMELLRQSVDYLTEGIELEDEDSGSVVNLVN